MILSDDRFFLTYITYIESKKTPTKNIMLPISDNFPFAGLVGFVKSGPSMIINAPIKAIIVPSISFFVIKSFKIKNPKNDINNGENTLNIDPSIADVLESPININDKQRTYPIVDENMSFFTLSKLIW